MLMATAFKLCRKFTKDVVVPSSDALKSVQACSSSLRICLVDRMQAATQDNLILRPDVVLEVALHGKLLATMLLSLYFDVHSCNLDTLMFLAGVASAEGQHRFMTRRNSHLQ